MINPSPVVAPSASVLRSGAVLWVVGSFVALVGSLAALVWELAGSGWEVAGTGLAIVGSLTALVGMVEVIFFGLYRLAANVDLAAHTALKILREVSAQAAPADTFGPPPPPPPEAAVPPPADGQGVTTPVSPEGIDSQLARLKAMRDAGTLTSEELDDMTTVALETWSAPDRSE